MRSTAVPAGARAEAAAPGGRAVAVLCGAALAYAALRYHVAGGVAWSHFPLWVGNKAAAFAAAGALLLACRGRGAAAAGWGRIAAGLAGLHVLMTLAQMAPAAYPKLYDAAGARLALRGEAALFAGVAAAGLMWRAGRPDLADRARRRAVAALLAAVAVHVALLGAAGWADPGSWPGGLPPITLLSAALLVAGLVALGRGGPGGSR